LPAGIVLGDAVELRDPVQDGGIVRLTRQEITEDEVTTHLNVGKVATRIAINWEDQVNMVLHEDVRLTGIKFDDRLVERAMDQGDGESAAAQFDADFVIMAETMAQLYVRITGLFGGIETGEDEGK
ncbi:recombination-associated protein RdgC, partial [Streptomyces scabiei]